MRLAFAMEKTSQPNSLNFEWMCVTSTLRNTLNTSTSRPVDLVQIYQCFCDRTRLRILNLLCETPLCVCHFQDLLNEPQVKVSKHLGYLKSRGLVEANREGNWMIYQLPRKMPSELEANLACLQDCAREDPIFRGDLARLKAAQPKIVKTSPICYSRKDRSVKCC